MKTNKFNATIVKLSTTGIMSIVILLPFHAFLTVWLASFLGHYTALRLWKELVLMVLLLGTGCLVAFEARLRNQLLHSRLVVCIAAYTLVAIVWGVVALARHAVTAKALGYGWIVDLRFLLFFLVVWLIASCSSQLSKRWLSITLWPALLVIVFGLLQYFVLPHDILKHFGYNLTTIPASETINHNNRYIRVMSTLRGANPLGAYLLLILSLLAVWWCQHKQKLYAVLTVLGALTLGLTFSRSAWIGSVLSAGVIVAVSLKTVRSQQRAGLAAVGLIVVVVGLFAIFHKSTSLQNALYHTSDTSTVAVSSNQAHSSALRSGLHDLVHEPLGRGPGSAGPASVYNNGKTRIAENYFVQVGQELGWLGLALFLAINGLVAKQLWLRRQQPLALGLLASLLGLTFVNLLSHAWADDTLAYVWWGLLGIALAVAPTVQTKKVQL